jgi:hypothetical protein
MLLQLPRPSIVISVSPAEGRRGTVTDAPSERRRKGHRQCRLGVRLMSLGLALFFVAMLVHASGAPRGGSAPGAADDPLVEPVPSVVADPPSDPALGAADDPSSEPPHGAVADPTSEPAPDSASQSASEPAIGGITAILLAITGLVTATSGLIAAVAGLIKAVRPASP